MEVAYEEIAGKKRAVALVEISWNGQVGNVKMKKLNFGENLDLRNECMKLTVLGGQEKIELDQKKMSEQSLLRSIVEAPFQINLESIRSLEPEDGEKLLSAFNELNNPSIKKKEN